MIKFLNKKNSNIKFIYLLSICLLSAARKLSGPSETTGQYAEMFSTWLNPHWEEVFDDLTGLELINTANIDSKISNNRIIITTTTTIKIMIL